MSKPEEQLTDARPGHHRTAFSVVFGAEGGASGQGAPQILIRNKQTGSQICLPENDVLAWSNWILEQLDPTPDDTVPAGESSMIHEFVEQTASREELVALYRQDMSASRALHEGVESTAAGGTAPQVVDPHSHTRVSNEAAAAGLIQIEEPAFGALGAPQDDNELEVAADVNMARLSRQYGPEALLESNEQLLLDAWHAQFNSPGTATVLRNPAVARAVTEAFEVVLGPDDRLQISNGLTEEYPWRCICSLRIVAADGSLWIGTGWLAGPRTVITAGHCVYIHNRGGWVRSIEVIPGRDAAARPFGASLATTFHSVAGWTEQGLRSCDYGAITLPAGDAFGEDLGWFGFAFYEDGALEDSMVNLSGYPGDKLPVGSQWFHSRRIEQLTPTTVVYMIDTAGGQSGAPVWWYLGDGRRVAVAIHTNGEFTGNSATRITAEVYDNILAWKEQDE